MIYLTPEEALAILDTTACTVKTNIALGEYQTMKGVVQNHVYIDCFYDYVHVKNITAIKDEGKDEFIPIQW